MADWIGDQVSDPSGPEELQEPREKESPFTQQLSTILATDSIDSIDLETLRSNIAEIDNEGMLERAYNISQREEAQDIFLDRMEKLDMDFESTNSETEENSPEEVLGGSDDEPSGESTNEENEESDSENVEESLKKEPEPKTSDDLVIGDINNIAPNAMTPTEAAEKEKRWTIQIWSDPGMGKTHFSYTSKDPVCLIDTEGKADNLAHKFQDKTFFLWQPSGYDEALDALHEALEVLDEYRNEENKIGTLAVDSMSVMWGWSQQKYVDKFYPSKDVEDVEFTSGFGGNKSDWKQIKRYHNVKFRQVMIDSPYHLVWTAMRDDDYSAVMSGESDTAPDKPAGEKENVYKVDEIIRLREDSRGRPVGELHKSGKIKHRYAGLTFPTWEKHRELVEEIDEAERNDTPFDPQVSKIESDWDVNVIEGNPKYARNEDDE